MAKKQNTPVFAGEKTGAKDRIGLFLRENLSHFKEIRRVVLEVRIMNYRQFCVSLGKGSANGRRFSLVGIVPKKKPFQFAGRRFGDR